jgi:DNA polymerase-3 subunit alpha
LSAHPLQEYQKHVSWLRIPTFNATLLQGQNNLSSQEIMVTGCGLVKSRRDIVTKKGDRMAFLQLEDMNSSAEIIIFPQLFKKVEPWLAAHNLFVVKGGLDLSSPQKCKIKANELIPLELFFQEWQKPLRLECEVSPGITPAALATLKTHLQAGTSSFDILFHENGKKLRLATKEKVEINFQICKTLEAEQHTITIDW